MALQKPLTPEDMKLNPSEETPTVNVILDGHVLEENLKYTGNDDVWLKKQLEQQHVHKISEVFLAICDADNVLTIYEKTNQKLKKEIFE